MLIISIIYRKIKLCQVVDVLKRAVVSCPLDTQRAPTAPPRAILTGQTQARSLQNLGELNIFSQFHEGKLNLMHQIVKEAYIKIQKLVH